jgi:hypothetical protein
MLAPGRFSTITGCPIRSESSCAVSRAATSVTEPGAIGTIMRIGRLG